MADIHEGLESALTLLESELRGRITIEKGYGDVPKVCFYPAEMNQVFMCLLRNATQAIDGSGKICIRTAMGDNEVIEFEDTGRGMDQNRLETVFQPRLKAHGNRVSASMGLFTSQNIVKKHHGEIEVTAPPARAAPSLSGSQPICSRRWRSRRRRERRSDHARPAVPSVWTVSDNSVI